MFRRGRALSAARALLRRCVHLTRRRDVSLTKRKVLGSSSNLEIDGEPPGLRSGCEARLWQTRFQARNDDLRQVSIARIGDRTAGGSRVIVCVSAVPVWQRNALHVPRGEHLN